jgi:hypothetical protein
VRGYSTRQDETQPRRIDLQVLLVLALDTNSDSIGLVGGPIKLESADRFVHFIDSNGDFPYHFYAFSYSL